MVIAPPCFYVSDREKSAFKKAKSGTNSPAVPLPTLSDQIYSLFFLFLLGGLFFLLGGCLWFWLGMGFASFTHCAIPL
jgi:hypothetical protein